MNEKHIKDAKLITSIFNTFKEGSAIIAGGYPRDLQLGRTPKDIDILIEFENEADYKEVHILANRLGYVVHDYSEGYGVNTDYGGQPRRVYGLSADSFSPVVIDVIFLNCPVRKRIINFPCTLSEAWLTTGGGVACSYEFHKAVLNKVMKFSVDCPAEYMERMKSYFPDYRVEYAD